MKYDIARDMMALLANLQRDPKIKPEAYEGRDFYRLRHDEITQKIEEETAKTPEEWFHKFNERFKDVDGSKRRTGKTGGPNNG